MGRIKINSEGCKGCGVCIQACPRGVLEFSPETNLKGLHPARVANEAACTGYGICVLVCPDVVITHEDDEPGGGE